MCGIADLERGGLTRLSVEGLNNVPVWMSDGSTVTFGSDRAGSSVNLYSKSPDSGGPAELLLAAPETLIAGSWSPDGETLVYAQTTAATNRDIWSLSANEHVPVIATEFNEFAPRLSPNGQWLAYVSDQAGENRVYMMTFPDGERVVPVSTGPGTEPVWSRDGSELFYRAGTAMMVVDIDPASDDMATRPRLLFDGDYAPDPIGLGIPNYDVASDGRFVMVTSAPPPPPRRWCW